MLDEVSSWGLDIFKADLYSDHRPLTAVMYQIFRVSYSYIVLRITCNIHFVQT